MIMGNIRDCPDLTPTVGKPTQHTASEKTCCTLWDVWVIVSRERNVPSAKTIDYIYI